MSAEIVKLSGAALCLSPPIGGLLVSLFVEQNANHGYNYKQRMTIVIAIINAAFMTVWTCANESLGVGRQSVYCKRKVRPTKAVIRIIIRPMPLYRPTLYEVLTADCC